jgi:hypothetical protein
MAAMPRANSVSHSEPRAMNFAEDSSSEEWRPPAGGDKDCRDFGSHDEAQAFFESNDAYEDPHRLDGDGDGIACERLR